MNSQDMVTDFAVREARISDLITALKKYSESIGLRPDEYGPTLSPAIQYDEPNAVVPERYWQLIAYAVEGGSEGYYVHVGCIVRGTSPDPKSADYLPRYIDFGFSKTYDHDNAFALAREYQRFLDAGAWN
jgi:hypothetical protein